ncbi:MAG: hypothetical protein SGBAC_003743 [Bacillariaceae sp.]
MEPMPLGPTTSSGRHSPVLQSIDDASSSESLFLTEDYPFSSSFSDLNRQLPLVADLFSILDPLIDFAGSKRSADGTNDESRKPQRNSQVLYEAPSEESKARFRPYQETQWREQFKKLVQYKLHNGHCSVPHAYPQDPGLARWVKRQRYQYTKLNGRNPTSTMTTRRIQELESIGFVWHSHASAWQEKLNELKAFEQSTGHCKIPSHYPENVALSTWVKCQRRQFRLFASGRSSTMTMGRYRKLASLGFVFEGTRKCDMTMM